jgi:uncharacterized protein involved in exopolysaccharide biosynthesis
MGLVMLRHRRILLLTPVVVGLLAATLLLVRGARYRADSAFRPQVSDASSGRLAGIAAQFGLSLPGAASLGDPVRFYAELAKSKDLLQDVATAEYRFRTPEGDSIIGNLASIYGTKGATPEEALQRAAYRVADDVDVTTNQQAGLVRVEVVTRWPELSVLINRRILRAIDTANLERRQSQAGAERKFIETRLQEVQEELNTAERNQERFLQQNRQYLNSPQLLLEFNRLQRQVDFRQQLFTTLAQGYEQARIDEVRDTPQLTIIDRPEGSSRKVGSLAKDLAMWLVIGAVLGVLLALLREFLWRQRAQDPAGYQQLFGFFRIRLPRDVHATAVRNAAE